MALRITFGNVIERVNFHRLTPVALAEYELRSPAPAAGQLHPSRLRAGHCEGRVKT